MEIVYFLLFLLVVSALFYLLNRGIRKAAYPKSERYLNFRLVIVASLVNMAVFNFYTFNMVIGRLNALLLSDVLRKVFAYILPNRAYELIYIFLLMLVLNIAVMIVTLVSVKLTRFILKNKTDFVDVDDYYGIVKLWHAPWRLVRKFYQYYEEQIVINGKGRALGVWAKRIKLIFLYLWLILMSVIIVSVLWGGKEWNTFLFSLVQSWYLVPMFGFLLAELVELFFDGEDDYEIGKFSSSNVNDKLIGDMEALMGEYHKVFGNSGALLYAENGNTEVKNKDGIYRNELSRGQTSSCDNSILLETMTGRLRDCGIQQCNSYQNALIALINGKSINIRDYIIGEAFIYVVSYLNYYVAQGKTALVLCASHDEAVRLKQAICKNLKIINDLYSIWNVGLIEDIGEEIHLSILVCTYEEFVNRRITVILNSFVKDLMCVVISDGMKLFSRSSVNVALLFSELVSIGKLQYVMFSNENNDALRTALEKMIAQEVIPFSNDVRYSNTCIMAWKDESYYKLQRYIGVGDEHSPYMGAALPLAILSLKKGMPNVKIVSNGKIADNSFRDTLDQNRKQIDSGSIYSLDLLNTIKYEPEALLDKQNVSIIILYDTEYNLFSSIWQWMKYGGQGGSLFHIVSLPYMLREYFIDSFSKKKLLFNYNEFDAIIPNSTVLDISRMVKLLLTIASEGMLSEEIMTRAREYNWNYSNVDELLADCLRIVLKTNDIHRIDECFKFNDEKYFVSENDVYVKSEKVSLIDDRVKDIIFDLIAPSQLVVADKARMNLEILANNVYNYVLPGQNIVINGYTYQINSISGRGEIVSTQNNFQDSVSYYQISDVNIKNLNVISSGKDNTEFDFDLLTANVTRNIYGYWSCNNGNDFSDASNVLINDIRDNAQKPISVDYDNATILRIKFKNNSESKTKMELLLAYMLSEVSKTLFPEIWQNLFVATGKWDNSLIDSVMKPGDSKDIDKMIRSIIPACSIDDDGIYVIECSCVEFGIVHAIYDNFQRIATILFNYIKWYIDHSKGTYLNFGCENMSELFDAMGLREVLKNVIPKYAPIDTSSANHTHASLHACTFCGNRMVSIYELDDGRYMCSECKDHQITQRDQIQQLYHSTKNYMNENYGINIGNNKNLYFKTAKEIADEATASGNGRILGLYIPMKKQLWLEASGPRLSMEAVLIHELTHSWQFDKLDINALKKKFKDHMDKFDVLIEGHATYVEITTMYKKNQFDYADRLVDNLNPDDEYGIGYSWIKEIMEKKLSAGSQVTPFSAMIELTNEILQGEVEVPCIKE